MRSGIRRDEAGSDFFWKRDLSSRFPELKIPEAHEFAYEAWGLRHSREAAVIGLLSAIGLSDPMEIPGWIRRRRAVVI